MTNQKNTKSNKPKIPLRIVYTDDGIEEFQYWSRGKWHYIPMVKIEGDIDLELELYSAYAPHCR